MASKYLECSSYDVQQVLGTPPGCYSGIRALRRSRGTRAVHHARASNGRIAGRNAATDGVGDGSATAELANAGCSSEFRRSEHDDSEHASTGNNFAERDAGSGRQLAAACANAAFDDA